MAINTIYRDNEKTGNREAWQHGVKVMDWSADELSKIRSELKSVPEFGHYDTNTPVRQGKRKSRD